MNEFTIEELDDLRLIYKNACRTVWSYDGLSFINRELTELEKSIIAKLENLILKHNEQSST